MPFDSQWTLCLGQRLLQRQQNWDGSLVLCKELLKIRSTPYKTLRLCVTMISDNSVKEIKIKTLKFVIDTPTASFLWQRVSRVIDILFRPALSLDWPFLKIQVFLAVSLNDFRGHELDAHC
ncbi:hypothetical protein CEXT_529781 [Caerostris extrusa]|uniref:Uncharacterized protein n=1 Tax=Caerostris extrusa TaxID=172846 RepID=A0AAV4TBC8_CAEEX|nr:hypothetical protein CEXT_529781 [Caerostris extrusa]